MQLNKKGLLVKLSDKGLFYSSMDFPVLDISILEFSMLDLSALDMRDSSRLFRSGFFHAGLSVKVSFQQWFYNTSVGATAWKEHFTSSFI